jgi:hypothetical protein
LFTLVPLPTTAPTQTPAPSLILRTINPILLPTPTPTPSPLRTIIRCIPGLTC